MELLNLLAGGKRIINFHRQTNRKRHDWHIWQNTWPVFYKYHTCFFLSMLNKAKHTAHMWAGGIKSLKHNVRTTLRLAYHGCKNITHKNKTRQVKRTHMFATAKFTIHDFLTFSDCKESNATQLWRDRMWGLNQNRRQKVFKKGNLHLRRGTWHSENLIKSLLIYSVSYLNLEGLNPPISPWRRDWFKIT